MSKTKLEKLLSFPVLSFSLFIPLLLFLFSSLSLSLSFLSLLLNIPIVLAKGESVRTPTVVTMVQQLLANGADLAIKTEATPSQPAETSLEFAGSFFVSFFLFPFLSFFFFLFIKINGIQQNREAQSCKRSFEIVGKER